MVDWSSAGQPTWFAGEPASELSEPAGVLARRAGLARWPGPSHCIPSQAKGQHSGRRPAKEQHSCTMLAVLPSDSNILAY